MVYLTPNLLVVLNFLVNTNIYLLVKSKRVRVVTSFAMLIDKTFLDLLDFLDIELVVIHELKHQQEDRFFDFYYYQVPQVW